MGSLRLREVRYCKQGETEIGRRKPILVIFSDAYRGLSYDRIERTLEDAFESKIDVYACLANGDVSRKRREAIENLIVGKNLISTPDKVKNDPCDVFVGITGHASPHVVEGYREACASRIPSMIIAGYHPVAIASFTQMFLK